jgi:hypothetical protein
MKTKTLDNFQKSKIVFTVSLFSDAHDGAVVISPYGDEIALDHENGFSFKSGDFCVSDDATAVIVYDGEFFIEQLISGVYFLQIENKSYVSRELDTLESILFGWID